MSKFGVFFDRSVYLRRHSDGWSKAYLVITSLVLSLLPAAVFGQSESSVQVSTPAQVELVLIGKLALPLAMAILANAAIPAFKYYYNQYRLKKSYLIYIRANVRSTLLNYGLTQSIETTVENIFDGRRPSWITVLEEEGLEVPELLHRIHIAFEKASEEQIQEEGYIPYVSYAGMPIPSDLDHEHPIWTMKKADTRHIADFLLSQAQAEKSIAQHYVSPIFDLAKSSNKSRRQQWVDGGYLIVGELAQHYINTMRLKRHLTVNG